MTFKKLIILSLIVLFGLIQANSNKITDWCPPCKRLIDDFSPELKTTYVQDVYNRACDAIYLEDQKTNKLCKEYNNRVYGNIREMLNTGKSAEEVCVELTACKNGEVDERQEMFSFQKQHQNFASQFGKVF